MHRRIWIRHPEGNTYGDGPQGTQNSKHTTLTCTRANHAPPSSLSKVSLVSSCPRGAPGRKLLGCILDTYTDLESFSNFRAHRYFVCYEYQVLTLSSVTNARAGWSNSYLNTRHVNLEGLAFGTTPADSPSLPPKEIQGTHVVAHAPILRTQAVASNASILLVVDTRIN